MKVGLIMFGIVLIEVVVAMFVHNNLGVPFVNVATAGIFIGWANSFLYLKISD